MTPNNSAPASSRRPALLERRSARIGLLAAAALAVLLPTAPAWAHSEFDPPAAAPGSVIKLALVAEDEQSSSALIKIQLAFPATPVIPVVEIPPTAGWASETTPATGTTGQVVTWTGNQNGDVRLALTIGPLPTEPGQVQFKVVQTYANGVVDRWIEDWPAGAPEPDKPGPVLQLKAGAAGQTPTTVQTTTASSTTSSVTSATSSQPPVATASPVPLGQAASEQPGSSKSSTTGSVILAVAVLVVLAGSGALILKARRKAR